MVTSDRRQPASRQLSDLQFHKNVLQSARAEGPPFADRRALRMALAPSVRFQGCFDGLEGKRTTYVITAREFD